MFFSLLPTKIQKQIGEKCPLQLFEIIEDLRDEIIFIRENKNFDIKNKSDSSPVTKADLLVHTTFSNILNLYTPDIPVLSEENKDSFQYVKKASLYWLLDPLDGTKEYINNYDDFAISLALIANGKPVFGMVYAPAKNEMYLGLCKEKISYKYKDNFWYRLKPSNTKKIQKIVVSRSHFDKTTEDIVKKYNADTVKMGSCLKFCYVAEGKADAYIKANHFYIWDVAGGHAILEATGCSLKNYNQENVVYNKGIKVEGIFAVNNLNLV
ncbi:MAG: 3'(2'),5'-bisphosphate nucleotidase CysQ [Alphaproteobacteria bacterium]